MEGRNIRVISRLDIKGEHLVKGVHLEGLRVLGHPEEFADYYYHSGADELVYMDVVASLYGRNSILSLVERTAKRTFIPLTVGGGVRTLDDIYALLRAGADKVSINTAALKNPRFIAEAAREFGSSTIVVSVEAIKDSDQVYRSYYDNGREASHREVVEWCREAQELMAGEIMLTSVDRDGTGVGYDLDLVRMITGALEIPVVAHGGAGKPEHVMELTQISELAGISMSSVLHYDAVPKIRHEVKTSVEGNTYFLSQNRGFKRIQPFGLSEAKAAVRASGRQCRI